MALEFDRTQYEIWDAIRQAAALQASAEVQDLVEDRISEAHNGIFVAIYNLINDPEVVVSLGTFPRILINMRTGPA